MSLSRDSTNKLCFTFFFNHDYSYEFTLHYIYMLSKHVGRDGTKISSWRINITSRWRIKKLGISLIIAGGVPGSWLLMLGFIHVVIAHTDQFRVILRTISWC